MTKTYYLGLDVHKETIAIAYATGGTREDSVDHEPCGGTGPSAGCPRRLQCDRAFEGAEMAPSRRR